MADDDISEPTELEAMEDRADLAEHQVRWLQTELRSIVARGITTVEGRMICQFCVRSYDDHDKGCPIGYAADVLRESFK